MPGTKRTADASDSAPATKVAKTEGASSTKTKNGPAIPTSEFKSKALPLHINITHTPPSVLEDDTDNAVPSDAGLIGNLTLIPSSFSTGSYGWKGNKRITVELQGSDGESKEKVQVMLSINATVVGSKQQASSSEKEESEEPSETKEDEDANGDVDDEVVEEK
ncbi:hypothetical protein BDQ17DRAFT_1421672 [Cyathus striatus]|nr:hypothetical protein BDQ17DRAFT_1421672 [Cyathus striatus]